VRFYMENGHFTFLRPPLEVLAATYDVHLRLIGMRVVDFLLALAFLLDATVDALRANID